MKTGVWVIGALGLMLSACAPSPLYHGMRVPKGVAVMGDIPRDNKGEPVWEHIKPRPSSNEIKGKFQP